MSIKDRHIFDFIGKDRLKKQLLNGVAEDHIAYGMMAESVPLVRSGTKPDGTRGYAVVDAERNIV